MIRLVETDWFRLVEDAALTAPVRPVGLSYRAYPYFMIYLFYGGKIVPALVP